MDIYLEDFLVEFGKKIIQLKKIIYYENTKIEIMRP